MALSVLFPITSRFVPWSCPQSVQFTRLFLQDVVVSGEFSRLIDSVRCFRPTFRVVHGDILWGRDAVLSELQLPRMKVRDPLVVVMEHVDSQDMRLVDLFTAHDSDNKGAVSRQDFMRAIKVQWETGAHARYRYDKSLNRPNKTWTNINMLPVKRTPCMTHILSWYWVTRYIISYSYKTWYFCIYNDETDLLFRKTPHNNVMLVAGDFVFFQKYFFNTPPLTHTITHSGRFSTTSNCSTCAVAVCPGGGGEPGGAAGSLAGGHAWQGLQRGDWLRVSGVHNQTQILLEYHCLSFTRMKVTKSFPSLLQ